MPRKKLELSAAEWEIMNVIWDAGIPLTVREVMERRYPNDEKAYTTVQTLMNILVDKGMLKRGKQGIANTYSPAVKRDAVLDASMSTVARRMFSGSFGAMATYLVHANKLSEEDIAALRALLDREEERHG